MQPYTKIFLSIFLVVSILFISFFWGIKYFETQLASFSGVIRAWVTINPLEVDVSCPKEAAIDKVFLVRAEIENKGKKKIEEAKGEIFLPEELETKKGGGQEIGVLPPKSKKFMFWPVKGKEVGNYVISVKVSGDLEGKLVSAEDSAMVKIKEFLKGQPWRWFQNFFDFFRR